MSAAISASSSLWSTSDAHDNVWRGPAASSSSSTLTAKPAALSVRKIRRKPAPSVPEDLLPLPSSSINTSSATSPRPALVAKSLNSPARSDTNPTQELQQSVVLTSSQKPQRQYLLDIDAPSTSQDSGCTEDDSVQRLLRSATISPSTASFRTRRLKWMHEKEEHTAAASSSAFSPRQPTLSRKTSISAHLKMSLRRNKVEEPATADISISGPTNFVHVATGGDGGQTAPNGAALKRASTVSARSALSTGSEGSGAPVEEDEDKPLYAAAMRSPLRPLRSIRRPNKLSLDKAVLDIPAGQTSPKDKRKAMYAAPGSVPVVLEPVSPGRGQMSPEPELSRSPSSGYESSEGTSNRSSLASLSEFRRFLDFPDLSVGKAREEEVDVWADARSGSIAVRGV